MSNSKEIKKIVVTSYDPEWPQVFEREASKIKEVLETNCIDIHHVGSTSVPGLSAKPVIDIIGIVKDLEKAIQPLAWQLLSHKVLMVSWERKPHDNGVDDDAPGESIQLFY